MGKLDLLDVRVTQITWCSPGILAYTLASTTGAALPGFQAGAHISIYLPVANKPARVRAYSLINVDPFSDTRHPQMCYRIAVRRDKSGSGGSLQLHESVRPGDVLQISPPKNEFQLIETQNPVLLAGGIGVTPIASMAAELHRQGIDFDFYYTVRRLEEAVFLNDLKSFCHEKLQLHMTEEAGRRLDIQAILQQAKPRPIYICGPKTMIDATVAAAATLNWPPGTVRSELFGADAASRSQSGYEVVLKHSDKTLYVHPGEALLDVLIDEDIDLPYDCRAGFCGLCQVKVLEGEVDHHDTCLTEADRKHGHLMQACISHAACSRLVLDL